ERKGGQELQVRKVLDELLKQAKDNLPPNFEGAENLAEQIAAATFSLDFSGETLLTLDIEATDEKAATAIQRLANNGIDLLKAGVPTLKKELKNGLPPDLIGPVSALVDELVNGLSLSKDGSHVVLSLKTPKQLPGLVDKLVPMLKDLGSRSSQPPP